MKTLKIAICVLLGFSPFATFTAEAEKPAVYFIAPASGAVLSSPISIQFGLRGMGVAPAGVQRDNTGHHHLLVNMPLDQLDLSQPLAANEHIRHFGGGQTETTISLPKGEHRLRLVLGDHFHRPHAEPVFSEEIIVRVE